MCFRALPPDLTMPRRAVSSSRPQLDFRKRHGHFDVPHPRTAAAAAAAGPAGGGDDPPSSSAATAANAKASRLHAWVNSLHRLYRQHQLGRTSGRLTDERVLLLVRHGFVFRKDWVRDAP